MKNSIIDRMHDTAIDYGQEKVEKLIEMSIRHWEDLRMGVAEDKFASPVACPLCQKFWTGNKEDSCFGCPIMNITEKQFCKGSPLDYVQHHYLQHGEGGDGELEVETCTICTSVCQMEIHFLEYVLYEFQWALQFLKGGKNG